MGQSSEKIKTIHNFDQKASPVDDENVRYVPTRNLWQHTPLGLDVRCSAPYRVPLFVGISCTPPSDSPV